MFRRLKFVPAVTGGLRQSQAMIREFYQAQEGKAFPYATQLTDAGGPLLSGGPDAYNGYNGFNAEASLRTTTPLSQRNALQHMQTYGGRDAIDWLAMAVNFTATAAASAGWHFDDAGVELAAKKLPTDPAEAKQAPAALVSLFNKPNPFMAWADLLELTLIDWLLVGNAYWVRWQVNGSNQPLSLYRMAPQFVKIRPGRFGPEKYIYKLPGDNLETEFDPQQVVHFKRPNPNDPYYGMGIVQTGSRALDMELGLTKTTASYYDRAGFPSGVVQTDRRVPRDVFNKLKRQIHQFYTGAQNAGQLMVLEAGLKYQAISPSAQDAAFLHMGQWSRDRVLAMFNMNKSLLGIWDTGDNPNIGLWQTLFDQKTMIPLCSKLSNVISRAVTQPGWGVDFCIEYTETQDPSAVIDRATKLAPLPGVKVHELRAAAGLTPSTGDKDIDETVLNLPGDNLNASGTGGTPDANLPTESGRPPNPENTRGFGRGSRGQPKKSPAAKAGGTSSARANTKSIEEKLDDLESMLEGIKALAPADHVHIGKLRGSHVTPPQDILVGKRSSELDVLGASVTRELQAAVHTLERGLLDAAEGKAGNTIYQRIKNSDAWESFRERLTQILDSAAQQAMSLANVHHVGQGLDSANVKYSDEVDSIIHRKSGGVNSIVKTLQKSVLAKVLSKQQKSAPESEVKSEIMETIDDWSKGKANGVALDTSVHAYNESTLIIAESNGVKDVLVSDGEDTDAPCVDANGSTWTIAEARENLQEHPNCRRAFVPVVS